MTKVKDITNELLQTESLRDLVNAYEEIASIRMKKTRDSLMKVSRLSTESGDADSISPLQQLQH